MTVTFVFEAGALRRREVRNVLRKLEFHNPGRLRWIEVKGLFESEFSADGDESIIGILQKILAENERPS